EVLVAEAAQRVGPAEPRQLGEWHRSVTVVPGHLHGAVQPQDVRVPPQIDGDAERRAKARIVGAVAAEAAGVVEGHAADGARAGTANAVARVDHDADAAAHEGGALGEALDRGGVVDGEDGRIAADAVAVVEALDGGGESGKKTEPGGQAQAEAEAPF